MHYVYKRRLAKLAKFLKTSKRVKDHFDLDGWSNIRFAACPSDLNRCETTACACGWAAVMPENVRAGLHLRFGIPRFRGREQWAAVEEFFGLSLEDAFQLFSVARYRELDEPTKDPKVVADRILYFLEHA